ncbi:hypothetical protein FOXYSP1_19267 [Fusarium oxysporum f. sp. phaseoli]
MVVLSPSSTTTRRGYRDRQPRATGEEYKQ